MLTITDAVDVVDAFVEGRTSMGVDGVVLLAGATGGVVFSLVKFVPVVLLVVVEV